MRFRDSMRFKWLLIRTNGKDKNPMFKWKTIQAWNFNLNLMRMKWLSQNTITLVILWLQTTN